MCFVASFFTSYFILFFYVCNIMSDFDDSEDESDEGAVPVLHVKIAKPAMRKHFNFLSTRYAIRRFWELTDNKIT